MRAKYQVVPIQSVRPHERNYNFHPEFQVDQLAKSAETFAQVRNIVVWRGKIIAGEGFWRGMVRAGQTHISIKDVSEWPEEKALAYMATDNELARMAQPDLGKLVEDLKQINIMSPDWAKLAAGGDGRLEQLLAEIPHFAPVGIEEQGRLDQKSPVTCPECGAEFVPK